MNAFDCTKELDVEISYDWQKWLQEKGYVSYDSATVCVFGDNLQILSLKFEVFRNFKRKTWAVYYPQVTKESTTLLFFNICNISYATFLLELGVVKTKEAVYRTIIEEKLNEGKK